MKPRDLTWNIDDPDSMKVVIRYQGSAMMTISMCEAIESCSRKAVLTHVKECDNSPWLKRWNNEKHTELIDILKS